MIHTMQGTYAGSINWFLDPASQVSSHYLIRSSDGQITQMVRNSDKAWQARSANTYSIGIEHEGFVDNPDWNTDTIYDESAKLAAYTCYAYLIDCSKTYDGPAHDAVFELSNDYTVKGHQYPDQANTDPGINWDWARYHALVNGGVIPPEVNLLPTAAFSSSCAGLTCSFDATASSDADGSIGTYAWDFGDGASGRFSTATHSFAVGGNYTVQLSVTDDQGAVHQTSSRRVVRVTLVPSNGNSGGGGAVSLWVVLALLFIRPLMAQGLPEKSAPTLELPAIHASAYYTIAGRIFANETHGETRYLTYWGAGEDFPSLGIGHFIWFPDGVDAPFDESFPSMMRYVEQHAGDCSSLPEWLRDLQPPAAPWTSKRQFDAAQQSERMLLLRQWLIDTAPEQARFIVASFSSRWNELSLPAEQKKPLTEVLQGLLRTPQGLFAVVDYYNFKGLGSNPRERYAGEGWGLVQVLADIAEQAESAEASDLVTRFSEAAAERLKRRVRNVPPTRNEARWLEGWLVRVADYQEVAGFVESTESRFRVTPYLQNPSATGMTLVWFSDHGTPGHVTIRSGDSNSPRVSQDLESAPMRACELAYHLAEYNDLEAAQDLPFRHVLRIDGLTPGQEYQYAVVQDGETASGKFRTPGPQDTALRFIVYGDSETEPESTGKNAAWSIPGDRTSERKYLVDQTVGYAANLNRIASRQPNFVAIAGDLVQSGGEQRDWDEFWQHNAGLGATIPIVPAAGNHDYYGGPGDLGGYSNHATRRAIGKFRSYFPNETYYSLDYGPAALIVIDVNNGVPERSSADTNWYLHGVEDGGIAPAWEPGSAQADWLERTLRKAQQEKQFTFVLFHHPPYSSGVHGKPPGLGAVENFGSGLPLRKLSPMFLRYGVTAVFNGHDELYEHSVVNSTQVREDGAQIDRAVHFYTVGIGGDGLRGPDPDVENFQSVFLADADAAEVFDSHGVLVGGGKHYGHVEVNLRANDDGSWQARIDPVYVFPVMNEDGTVHRFERRLYDDVTFFEGRHDD